MQAGDRRGLGRGLGAIIRDVGTTDLVDAPASHSSEHRPVPTGLVERMVEAGLDLLEPFDLTHLGYLHWAHGGTPLLIMRRPRLDHTDATTVYRLMASLDRAAASLEHPHHTTLDDHHLAFIPSRGPHSNGVHVVGSAAPFDRSTRSAIDRRCHAGARLVHQLHLTMGDETLPEMRAWTVGDDQAVEVRMPDHRGDPSTTQATAATTEEAVARAITAARDNGVTLRRSVRLPVGAEATAVLCVLEDDAGEPRLGVCLAPADTDVSQVAAAATLRALR